MQNNIFENHFEVNVNDFAISHRFDTREEATEFLEQKKLESETRSIVVYECRPIQVIDRVGSDWKKENPSLERPGV